MEYEEVGGDDEDIGQEQDGTETDVAVLVDAGGDNICATGATIVEKDDTKSDALDCSSDDARHKRLVAEYLRQLAVNSKELLSRTHGKRHENDGINRVGQKLKAKYLQRQDEQEDVDDEVGVGWLEAGRKVYDGCDTCYTAAGNMIRQLETYVPCDVEDDAEGHK